MTQDSGWIALRRLPRESASRAVVVTLLVCALCSALIAFTVETLAPYRERNRAAQQRARIQEIVAALPGLAEAVGTLKTARLDAHVVDLSTGTYVENADPASFEARKAALDTETSVALAPELDLAGIGRRATQAVVFLAHEGDSLRLVVLPVYGAGYMSTLYGYLALDADLNTVHSLSFYEHGETPGLGSEIENPAWRAKWSGKRLRDESGALRIEVARGPTSPGADASLYQVDGISGATRTCRGVTNLLHFWVGPDGFGPYLQRIHDESDNS